MSYVGRPKFMRGLVLFLKLLMMVILISPYLTAQETPKREFFFAFFADGSLVPFQEMLHTAFSLTNPGQRVAQIRIRVFSKAGTELVTLSPFTLGVRASRIVKTAVVDRAPGALSIGWARIESTEPISALQYVDRIGFISILGAPFPAPETTLATVAIPSAIPTRHFTLSVIEDEEWGSGISIAAPISTGNISGVLTLLDGTGQMISVRQVSVNFSTQLVKTAVELFPELAAIKTGTILCEFSADVIVTSLRFGKVNRSGTKNFLYVSNLASGEVTQ